jgi:SAM-dependent methyltransferase
MWSEYRRRRAKASFEEVWRAPSQTVSPAMANYKAAIYKDIICQEEICIDPAWFQHRTVLELGCGNGRWTGALLRLGSRVTAVDISKAACDQVQQSYSGFGELEVVEASILDLPETVAGRRYDLVCSWGVLHHTGDTMGAIRAAAGLVKQDGLLYFYTYGHIQGLKGFLGQCRDTIFAVIPSSAQSSVVRLVYPGQTLDSVLVNRPGIQDRPRRERVIHALKVDGFDSVEETISGTEDLFIRAYNRNSTAIGALRPPPKPPYWFQSSKPGNLRERLLAQYAYLVNDERNGSTAH